MKPDTNTAYGSISRLLHWSMAAAFGYMLFTAIAWNVDEAYFGLMDNHKSVGFILLLLALLRVWWALLNLTRRPSGNLAATLGHGVLYLLMLAVPLAALLRQYGSARGELKVFGLPVMPAASEKIDWMVNIGSQWHGELAWLLFALVSGHIVAALVHQLRGEKILNRMAGPRR